MDLPPSLSPPPIYLAFAPPPFPFSFLLFDFPAALLLGSLLATHVANAILNAAARAIAARLLLNKSLRAFIFVRYGSAP